jgi:hypothetical protein
MKNTVSNTYIRFEKYDALMGMNDDRWTSVDGHLWMDICGRMSMDGRWWIDGRNLDVETGCQNRTLELDVKTRWTELDVKTRWTELDVKTRWTKPN